jgi:hypothetical protein
VSKKPAGDFPEIAKGIKDMIALAKTFDEKAKSIEIAMKFETMKHKLKGNEFGKGFDNGGEDDDF